MDRFGWSALRYRPFQLFLLAMFAANVGGFIYIAALGWFVLTLTGSAAAVGVAYAANGIPQLLLTIHAGVFTDRVGARAMVALGIGCAGLAMILAAGVTLLPAPPFELIVLAAGLAGAGYALAGPGSLSIVSELVPPADMSSSVALNWLQLNVARIAGGLGAGLVLTLGSPAIALALAGVLNGAPALIILTLRLREDSATRLAVSASSLLRPVIEALSYARRFPTLAVVVLLAAAPGAIGLSYIYLLPIAAKELGIGADGLGSLIAASGVGGLVTGLALESVQRRWGHGRALFAGLGMAAAALIGFGFASSPVAALLLLPFVGGGFAMYAAATGTLIQALAPARLRGRLVGLFATLYWGLLPVGSILGGAMALVSSGRSAVLVTGMLLAAVAFVAFLARPQLLTLKVEPDGLTLSGDLRGTGVEAAD
jgi:MFS family permease